MKIVTVLGARPQFIKASPVSHAFSQMDGVEEIVVHTGQHFDQNMSDIFFQEMGMKPPAHQLSIHGGRHGHMTGRMLSEVEQVLVAEAPQIVLVYGDTNSTLAGALAAVKLHIPVAHVEAGLRSFNWRMPEEINRILTDRISRWLFTPTETAGANLRQEGVDPSKIHYVGDVMYDACLHHGRRATSGGILAELSLEAKSFILVTIHRAENVDDPGRLNVILEALATAAEEMQVVWPMHPRTRNMLKAAGEFNSLADRLTLVDPVGYLDMVRLERDAAVIATDSGGVQKEAFFHGVPCVTIRDETEWTELVDAGWNELAPPVTSQSIAQAILRARGRRGDAISPYGSGNAAQSIATILATSIP